jgi:polyphosphate kinase
MPWSLSKPDTSSRSRGAITSHATAPRPNPLRRARPMAPPVRKVVALAAPNEQERTQRYFQRYVANLPSAGQIVLFDRSWYNRAGVERVMGFCTEDELLEFLRSCPEFERMVIRSGIQLVKYSPRPTRSSRRGSSSPPTTRRWRASTASITC